MDTCPVCSTQFKRHYRIGGIRQEYCSKKCKYEASYVDRVCPTCNKTFRVNKLSRRKEYCSLACIERSPCQLCGKIITGRATFQSGEKRFCSRRCSNIVNRTLQSKKKYTVIGFANTITKTGTLACEKCGEADPRTLVIHHIDRNHANITKENLMTLCANCHFKEHWSDSVNRAKNIEVAHYIAKLPS